MREQQCAGGEGITRKARPFLQPPVAVAREDWEGLRLTVQTWNSTLTPRSGGLTIYTARITGGKVRMLLLSPLGLPPTQRSSTVGTISHTRELLPAPPWDHHPHKRAASSSTWGTNRHAGKQLHVSTLSHIPACPQNTAIGLKLFFMAIQVSW